MANPGMWVSDKRLYLDRTRKRVVPQDSPDVGFVLVGAGGEIPLAQAEALGLVKVREAVVRDVALEEVAPPVAVASEPVAATETVTVATEPEPPAPPPAPPDEEKPKGGGRKS